MAVAVQHDPGLLTTRAGFHRLDTRLGRCYNSLSLGVIVHDATVGRTDHIRVMADLDTQRTEPATEDDYTTAEIIYWIVGIFMIPLVPILFVWFFTPWSGM